VTVPPGGGHRHRDGIVVHRSLLAPEEIVVHRGIRVTSLLRTLLDIAAVVGPPGLARGVEEAQVLHGLAPEDVAVAVLTRAGFRGNARLRVVLDGAVDPAAVRSVLELRFLRLCAQGGVRRPLVNVPVGGWVPDFRWEAERVTVETDGVRFHRTAAKRLRDARKDEALRALGYLVIRLTWADVVQRPERTLALVDGALAAGRAAA
jgi:very-short-patch-repair endonuclease